MRRDRNERRRNVGDDVETILGDNDVVDKGEEEYGSFMHERPIDSGTGPAGVGREHWLTTHTMRGAAWALGYGPAGGDQRQDAMHRI